MVRHALWALLGMLMLAGRVAAGEGDAPKKEEPKKEEVKKEEPKKEEPAAKEKAADPLASVRGKLTAARQKLIKSKPELDQEYKQFGDREQQIKKDREAFYAKLRPLSPEIDELEKEKEKIEAERKRKDEEGRKARPRRKGKAKE